MPRKTIATFANQRKETARHSWQFKPRFRRGAFGWKSQPAISRIGQAVAEIRKAAKTDPVVAAEGAVVFLERVSPAIEHVDSSSGAIGSCVNRAIDELAPLIAKAPADMKTRDRWLERVFDAYLSDEIPYLERLGEVWGEVCGAKEVASMWADRLLEVARTALEPERGPGGYSKVTSACLSAMYCAGKFDELIGLLRSEGFWHYRKWMVRAMAAKGLVDDAIRMAESSRGRYSSDAEIDWTCEEILLAASRADEAYAGYGVRANQGATYLATFRAVAKKYPRKTPKEIILDLARSTPGEEGKWFAAAKDAGLYAEALGLARQSPCEPRTLTRAARDFAGKQPAFAVGSGLLAMHWLVRGYGYEITGADVWAAYGATMAAAPGMAARRKRKSASAKC